MDKFSKDMLELSPPFIASIFRPGQTVERDIFLAGVLSWRMVVLYHAAKKGFNIARLYEKECFDKYYDKELNISKKLMLRSEYRNAYAHPPGGDQYSEAKTAFKKYLQKLCHDFFPYLRICRVIGSEDVGAYTEVDVEEYKGLTIQQKKYGLQGTQRRLDSNTILLRFQSKFYPVDPVLTMDDSLRLHFLGIPRKNNNYELILNDNITTFTNDTTFPEDKKIPFQGFRKKKFQSTSERKKVKTWQDLIFLCRDLNFEPPYEHQNQVDSTLQSILEQTELELVDPQSEGESGGFGVVYHVQDENQKQYALKVLGVSLQEEVVRAHNRYHSLIGSSNTNVPSSLVRTYTFSQETEIFFTDSDCRAIWMEWVDGKTLEECVRNKPKPVFSKRQSLCEEILNGIQFLHNKGLCHNDIHSKNIMVRRNFFSEENSSKCVKIIDVGMINMPSINSRVTQTGTRDRNAIIGRAPFFDQSFVGKGLFSDHAYRADVHALGWILFQILEWLPDEQLEARFEVFRRRTKIKEGDESELEFSFKKLIDDMVCDVSLRSENAIICFNSWKKVKKESITVGSRFPIWYNQEQQYLTIIDYFQDKDVFLGRSGKHLFLICCAGKRSNKCDKYYFEQAFEFGENVYTFISIHQHQALIRFDDWLRPREQDKLIGFSVFLKSMTFILRFFVQNNVPVVHSYKDFWITLGNGYIPSGLYFLERYHNKKADKNGERNVFEAINALLKNLKIEAVDIPSFYRIVASEKQYEDINIDIPKDMTIVFQDKEFDCSFLLKILFTLFFDWYQDRDEEKKIELERLLNLISALSNQEYSIIDSFQYKGDLELESILENTEVYVIDHKKDIISMKTMRKKEKTPRKFHGLGLIDDGMEEKKEGEIITPIIESPRKDWDKEDWIHKAFVHPRENYRRIDENVLDKIEAEAHSKIIKFSIQENLSFGSLNSNSKSNTPNQDSTDHKDYFKNLYIGIENSLKYGSIDIGSDYLDTQRTNRMHELKDELLFLTHFLFLCWREDRGDIIASEDILYHNRLQSLLVTLGSKKKLEHPCVQKIKNRINTMYDYFGPQQIIWKKISETQKWLSGFKEEIDHFSKECLQFSLEKALINQPDSAESRSELRDSFFEEQYESLKEAKLLDVLHRDVYLFKDKEVVSNEEFWTYVNKNDFSGTKKVKKS